MKITSNTRYQISVKVDRSYSVMSPGGKKHFVSPDTVSGQKLYLVGLNGNLHYVGITNTPMSARINMGLKAKGSNGYHGYKWKSIRKPLTLDVLCWSGKGAIRKALEAIEAEIAYLCRNDTGEWPISQTEIHFRTPSSKHKKMAEQIYEQFKAGNKANPAVAKKQRN
jgi:hypothetical protein